MKYDVFICHASEDKKSFVKPLADALVKEDIKVWYDEFELTLGDRLREKIDYGLKNSTYGVVVLSNAFFEKKWPKEELDGLVARQTSEGDKVILPIWHGVGYEDVKKFSPMLAGKLAARSEEGLDAVITKILNVCKEGLPPRRKSVFQTKETIGLRERCLELLREDNIISWRDAVEKLTNETAAKLLAWKHNGETAILSAKSDQPNREPWKIAVSEAVKISVPGFIPILTAIQTSKENYWRESIGFLRRLLLLYGDMGSGIIQVRRIVEDILYIAGSLGMAIATRTRQLNFINLWAEMTIPEVEGTGETTWWKTSKINYWQTGITGHNSNPYGFVIQLSEIDDIKPFFVSEQNFKESLFIGNLLHSLVEFRHQASQSNYDENLKSEHFQPNVMPIWSIMEPNDFKKGVWKIFGSSDEVIKFAYPGIMPTAKKFWPLWQTWKEKCVKIMSDGGRYRGHLLNVYHLNLPGEPHIQT